MNAPSQALETAIQLHRQGRLADAETAYRNILSAEPRNSDALQLLGLVVYHKRDLASAIQLIEQAIAINDRDPSYHSNLGRILGEIGRAEDAIASCRRALALDPGFVDAHNNLAAALAARGDWDGAAAEYQRALALAPGSLELLNNLATALRHQGNRQAASELNRRALDLSPANVDALLALAADARMSGDLYEAAVLCRRALAGKPGHARALLELGNIQRRQGQLKEAVATYELAVANGAEGPEVHYNLGALFEVRNRLDQAQNSYRRALELHPGFPGAELGLVHVAQQLCQWDELDERVTRLQRLVGQPIYPALSPFSFLSLPGVSPADQRRWAEHWVEDRYGAPALNRPDWKSHSRTPGDGRIRLGYLSADYHDHATAYLIAELIELHDKARFQVNAYSYGPSDDGAMRRRLGAAFDRFLDIRSMSFMEAARRINDDGIDILIDLKGYTQNTRSDILALRPAPIQVNYLGYPGTMGADFIDYLVTDEFIVPPGAERDYSEALAYLPHCYQPNDRQRPIGARPTRRDCGLPEQGLVFCCMNRTYKITREVFDLWCRLLKAVPESVLWLHKSNRWADVNLAEAAGRRGIDGARLVFAEKLPLAQHLGRLQLADLFLDTLPYNAHTTASDALWCGVPVVTCAGDTFAGRVAGSLLTAVGLPELVTHDLDGYYRLALRLASDPAELAAVKARLARNRLTTPLFDTPRYTRDLEALFAEMHRRRQAGEPNSPIRLAR